MYAQTLNLPSKRNVDTGTTPARPLGSLASRIPRRSVRQVYALSLSGDDQSSASRNDVPTFERPRLKEARMRVNVATIPSSDRNCRHNVFIDNGGRLQKLDLPSTACVAVSQRFEARAGDTLSYDYVILLQATNGFTADRPAVRAVLVNHRTESAVSLMDRSIDRERITHPQRLGSRFRESQSFTVPTAGHYELRFITFVDRSHPGSEAHLLVNSVRILSSSGQEVTRLASLSCIGRVRQPACDESVN